LVIEELGKKWG